MVSPDKALDIYDSFCSYAQTRNESIIKKYRLEDLKGATAFLYKQYKNTKAYEELDDRIRALESKWWDREIVRNIISAIIGAIVSALVTVYLTLKVFRI